MAKTRKLFERITAIILSLTVVIISLSGSALAERSLILPEILGAQIGQNEELRFKATVEKEAYEALKSQFPIVEYGFLVADSKKLTNTELKFGVDGEYENHPSSTMYLSEENGNDLVFTTVLGLFETNAVRSSEMLVRAYIRCVDAKGKETVYYSLDGDRGGYAVSWDEIASEAASQEAKKQLENINYIPDNTPVTEVKPAANPSPRVAGKPYAVNVKYDDGSGVCIAIYDAVQDFGAPVNNTAVDSSAHIQKALDAAAKKGGGVVYLPEGLYRMESPITVPSGVTLRGEWQSPDIAPAGKGTVLLVRTGGISVCETPFVSLKTGGGFRNITVLYPGTAEGNLTQFSSTIAETPSGGSDSYTVMNVTILGGSVGFDAATAWSELHYLKNVYISSLKKGIKINYVSDIGRIENVHISPRYLLENTAVVMTAENKQKISDYMYNNADGLYIQRSDWQYVYDLEIEGVNRGIAFESYIDTADNNRVRGSNGQMFGMTLSGCKTAVDVVYTNAIGYAFTDISVSDCQTGFDFGSDFMACFEITNLEFKGSIAVPLFVASDNNGKVTVTNSSFGCNGIQNYAVTVKGGSLSLQQCDFELDKKHVIINPTSGAVSVLGCTFKGEPDIFYTLGRGDYIKIDNSPLNLPISTYKHTYRKTIPTAASMDVYDVTDYGAKSGRDSTAAFKAALSAAGKTGGTVYVPCGEYYVYEPLLVPSGVELRGIYDVPTHPVTKGSVICTNYGKYKENATPFVSLEENSGINGINFYYTEQSYTNFIPYAWTVRSLGKNCWAKNCVFLNSYNALDFATNPSDGHYINYIGGSPLRRGIFVGNNSSNGWVENVQFNPHYWKRASITNMDVTDAAKLNDRLNYSLEAMIFGDNASEHVLGTFGYAAKDLLVFTDQGMGGTNGVFIGHGSDGCRNALVAHELDCVVMINSELVSMNYTEDMHHIVMKPTVTGTLAQFNMTAWSNPLNSSIKIDAGNLIIAQLFYYNLEKTINIAEVGGGTLYMSSSMLPIKDTHFTVKGKGRIGLTANLTKAQSTLPPACREALRYTRSAGAISQTHSWWV